MFTGPAGCFVVWRRLAYFGETIAHSALLGVAFAILLDLQLVVGIFAAASAVVLVMLHLERRDTLPTDTLLGLLAHGGLALGLVLLSFFPNMRLDLQALLFGDILAVSRTDLVMIWVGGAVALWRWGCCVGSGARGRQEAFADSRPAAVTWAEFARPFTPPKCPVEASSRERHRKSCLATGDDTTTVGRSETARCSSRNGGGIVGAAFQLDLHRDVADIEAFRQPGLNLGNGRILVGAVDNSCVQGQQ